MKLGWPLCRPLQGRDSGRTICSPAIPSTLRHVQAPIETVTALAIVTLCLEHLADLCDCMVMVWSGTLSSAQVQHLATQPSATAHCNTARQHSRPRSRAQPRPANDQMTPSSASRNVASNPRSHSAAQPSSAQHSIAEPSTLVRARLMRTSHPICTYTSRRSFPEFMHREKMHCLCCVQRKSGAA